MAKLTLSVRWLTEGPACASYHGDDWPPAPLRLFQALVASARRQHAGSTAFDEALEHLAALPPPLIYAPAPWPCAPVNASVPNNDGDKVMELLAKGLTGKARTSVSKLRTLRERAGWNLDAPLHYVWTATDDTVRFMPALSAICAGVVAVGQGIDLAWVTSELSPSEPRLTGLCHTPTPGAQTQLKVPYPGVLRFLDDRHQALRSRIGEGSVAGVPEPRHLLVGYQSPLTLPFRRSAAFALRTPGDSPWSITGSTGVLVAAMVRHAVHQAATKAGLDAQHISELMGHGGDGRIHVLPAPNVGHEWADGRIRRVILSCGVEVSENDWTAVLYRLTGADLKPIDATQPVAMLAPAPEKDTVLWRYTGRSMRWTTATPVVLPGWDERRGKPRRARTARRLLSHAGIPSEAVASVDFEPAARLSGVCGINEYRVSKHLEKYPRAHVSIRFREPVYGPMSLGAGAGIGMGLLSIFEGSSNGSNPGQRSRR